MAIYSVMIRLVLALVSCCISSTLMAQDWPTKPARLLVPWGAGSPPDISSRVLAEKLSLSLGQPVVVENRPGAIGTVALTELLRQPADGYTLYNFGMPISAAPALLPRANIDFAKDIAPVGQYDWTFSVLVVNPSVQAKNTSELIELLRARPNQMSFASGGHGTPAHLAGELFKLQHKVSASHVPYNQFPQAMADLWTGRVDFMFLTSVVAVPSVGSGKLRALAVLTENRLPALPNVSTLAEQGFKDFDVRSWDGFVVRAGTPRPIIDRLNRELNNVVGLPDVRERFGSLGMEAVTGTPEQFGALIKTEADRWGQVIRNAKVKID